MQPTRTFLGKGVTNFSANSSVVEWIWKRPSPFYQEVNWSKNVRIELDKVLAVKKVGFDSCCGRYGLWFTQAQAGFSLYSVCQLGSSRWGIEQWLATCPSTDADNYIRDIQFYLRLKIGRPQSLLVFINPYGGRRKAERIYHQKVSPIFDLANILSTVVVTEHEGHSKEYLLNEDLSMYDGVIAVGGDGLFSEVLFGVLYRQRIDSKLSLYTFHTPDSIEVTPRLRLGLIPAGSTNATLMSLHGTDDLTTAALHIALGDNSGLDVLAVHDGETGAFLRYTVSLLGYGFHGDLLEPSENLRWMGPDRYNVAGALNFLRLASYYGRVSYLPSRTSAHPLDATVCHAACKICAEALEDPPIAPADKPAENPMPDSIDVRFPSPVHEPTSPTFIPSDSDEIHVVRGDKANTHEDAEESYHSNSEIEVSVNHKNKCKRKWLKRFLSKSVQALPLVDSSGDFNLKPGWESVTGSFIAINAFPISCRCVKSPQGPAPSAHLGDGCLDLILVHKCSHHEFLQYLVLLTNAKSSGASAHHPAVTAEHLKLPFVEVHRVHAMEFTPLDRNNRPLPACTPSTMYDSVLTASVHAKHRDPNVSVWCVDGEILRQAHVFCRMHRQLVRVFGRGPED